jgi:hypothetical protein
MLKTHPIKELTPQLLAKIVLETYLKEGKIISPPTDLPDFLKVKAGSFVSIKTLKGELRGCIGTIEPSCENVAVEIINNTIKAATQDYRFNPVEESELDHLVYSVDILSLPEPIETLENHNVEIYGLIIETLQGRRGVLLPALPGIDTAETQLRALQNKIGISQNVPIKMSRFSVDRYGKK